MTSPPVRWTQVSPGLVVGLVAGWVVYAVTAFLGYGRLLGEGVDRSTEVTTTLVSLGVVPVLAGVALLVSQVRGLAVGLLLGVVIGSLVGGGVCAGLSLR